MTYQDAIKRLKVCGNECLDCLSCKEHDDAAEIAIIAMEKQVPKKPELWHNQPCPPEWADDDWGYRCPTCGNEDIDYPEHHCSCGQALDWGDIK